MEPIPRTSREDYAGRRGQNPLARCCEAFFEAVCCGASAAQADRNAAAAARRSRLESTSETRLLATPPGARGGRPRAVGSPLSAPSTASSDTPSPSQENDHAALLLSFDGRSGARSGTALRALQRDSAEEEGDEALGEETHLPGTPSPTSQGAPSCATDSAEGGGAAAAAKKTAAAAAAGGCGDAGESYAPLLGTPLRRPKSYSALSPPEGCTPTEHEDDHCCPTCLEEFTPENPQIVLQCAHAFHLACIYEWAERSEVCPVCGAQMVFEEQS